MGRYNFDACTNNIVRFNDSHFGRTRSIGVFDCANSIGRHVRFGILRVFFLHHQRQSNQRQEVPFSSDERYYAPKFEIQCTYSRPNLSNYLLPRVESFVSIVGTNRLEIIVVSVALFVARNHDASTYRRRTLHYDAVEYIPVRRTRNIRYCQ